jgi:LysR family transcriptional regulator, cys regulon transcriptional activator
LRQGQVDIAIATESLTQVDDLVSFEFYRWHHAIVVPAGHPLEQSVQLTLEDVARYPVITYHEGFTGRASVDKIFSDAGLQPDVVMSALDADVIKSYVELGLGIGIVASIAFNPQKDLTLRLLDSQHLFAEKITRIAVHRSHYLRGFAYQFIELCAPALSKNKVLEAIAEGDVENEARISA